MSKIVSAIGLSAMISFALAAQSADLSKADVCVLNRVMDDIMDSANAYLFTQTRRDTRKHPQYVEFITELCEEETESKVSEAIDHLRRDGIATFIIPWRQGL